MNGETYVVSVNEFSAMCNWQVVGVQVVTESVQGQSLEEGRYVKVSNDLERPLTWFSRSRHSLTLNISQTATDMAIVTMEGE